MTVNPFSCQHKAEFPENALYFLPVAIGAAIGIVLFAVVVEKAFGNIAALFVSLFVDL
jgi:putative membrane protein